MYIRKLKTKKLFYKKYVNRVAIRTQLAFFFREKLDGIENRLRTALDRHDHNKEMRVLVAKMYVDKYSTPDEIHSLLNLIQLLREIKDYSMRIEGSCLAIFFNDSQYIDRIKNIKHIVVDEITTPESEAVREFLLNTPDTIISKDHYYRYKVYTRPLKSEAENFKSWATKMNKIYAATEDYYKGGHFYVADSKTLGLCRLYLGGKIRKIEEIVASYEI